MNMRKLLIVLMGCVFAVAAFAMPLAESETGPILIGVAGPHSGDLAPYGIPTVHAAELVADRVNAAGGINGRLVELIIEDDECSEATAANTAAKLVSDGVVGVIGHICSGATGVALPIYMESDILIISPSATNPTLTENENFYRTISPDDAQAALQANFAIDALGVSSVAILHDQQSYGQGLADLTKGFLEAAGVDIPVYEGITVGAVDYSAVINLIDAADVDLVIFGGYHPEASKLVTQMRDRGMDVPFMAGDGIKDQSFLNLAGAAAEGVYATGPQDTAGNPLVAEYQQAHVDAYGEEPGAFFLEGVAATLALVNAIEAAGSTSYDAITNALHTEYVDTPVGRISFDEKGDATGIGFSVYQVVNGVYVEQ